MQRRRWQRLLTGHSKRTVVRNAALLVGLIVFLAACSGSASPAASTASSRPAASASAARPTPSSSAVSPTPASSARESTAASSPATVGDFKRYADATLRPVLDDLSDAFDAWGEAFTAVARAGASDADKAAYAAASTDLRDSLSDAQTAVDNAPTPPCAGEARASAAAFLTFVRNGLDPLLSKSSIGIGDLLAAGSLLQEATEQVPEVAAAIQGACR